MNLVKSRDSMLNDYLNGENLMAYWKIIVETGSLRNGVHQKLLRSFVSTSYTLSGLWRVNNIKDQSRPTKVCFVLYEVKDDHFKK